MPLNTWLLAFYLVCSSKKGMSAHQLHWILDGSYKTWFIVHRVREAMHEPASAERLSGVVEVDETYMGGRRRGGTRGRGARGKTPVVALVDRADARMVAWRT